MKVRSYQHAESAGAGPRAHIVGYDGSTPDQKIFERGAVSVPLLFYMSTSQYITFKPPKRRHAVKLPDYKIEEIKELGNNPAITAYLKERDVWQVAQGKLKEVYYYSEDQKKQRKHFFAAGHQNENGGWQVRSKNFEGCIGQKGLTIIPGQPNQVFVFENFFGYLEQFAEHQQQTTAIIINDPALLPQAKAIEKAATFFNTRLPVNEKY